MSSSYWYWIWEKIKKLKVLVWILVISAVVGVLFWFVPGVWRLKLGTITVTQWKKTKGATQVIVGPDKAGWIDPRSVSKNVLNAFVVAEDARFYSHCGLDFNEIINSAALNLNRGVYVRGASTITQQVVKMSLLSRDKSMIRKLREATGALLLELIASKEEILAWYINLAEFGDGIYGLRAAASHYFQTKPELLTIQQAAHLALVLPSPNGWSFGLRRRNLTDFGHRRYASIVTNMKLAGYITETQWLNALATGNFGRPVHYYERMFDTAQRRTATAPTDIEEDPEEQDELIQAEEDPELEHQEEEETVPETP